MPTSVKIDFIVPGFSKCGTTTLCALLDLHPDVYIPPIKEPWYFSHDKFETQHQCYDEHYAAAQPGQLKGDGSTSYTGYLREDISIKRIYENNPACRFIFIARNPKSRIESSYREMHHSGVHFGLNAPYPIGECLRYFPQMVEDTLFWERISKYHKQFGEESILVVFLEELKADQAGVLQRCFDHLGLDATKMPDTHTVNLNAGSRKLYDSRLYRFLRTNGVTGLRLARLTGEEQDKLFAPLGLRKAFGKKPLEWDEYARDVFDKDIVPDCLQFLQHYGKPREFWKL
ncbi:MAG: sulfotransferase [Gammaproteobacteria bacterium]|nr:sulfotransferase [Gammaproteobacteria bacterium]